MQALSGMSVFRFRYRKRFLKNSHFFSGGYIFIAGIWLISGFFFASVSYCAAECIKKDNSLASVDRRDLAARLAGYFLTWIGKHPIPCGFWKPIFTRRRISQ